MSRWWCILCGKKNRASAAEREGIMCGWCGSNWRVRATELGVLIGTGSEWAPFPDVMANYFWRGLGTSDHMALAGALSSRFDYANS